MINLSNLIKVEKQFNKLLQIALSIFNQLIKQ